MEGTHDLSLVEKLKSTEEGRCRLLTERAIVRVTEQLEEAMDARGVTRTKLAQLLGKSKGWVTQLLDGENNKTIRTVAYAFSILGAQFETGFTFPLDVMPVTPGATFGFAYEIPLSADLWTGHSPHSTRTANVAIKRLPRDFDKIALESVSDGT